MLRLVAFLLWMALESAVKLAVKPLIWLGRVVHRAWVKNKVGEKLFPKRAERRKAKGETVGWLKSRTIQGLAASGVALALGFLVGDAESAALAERVTAWLLDGVQIGGLVWAARGRKLAEGPL